MKKMKSVIAMLCVISMVFSLIVVPAVATDILTEKEECLSATPENGVLLYETLAVTQEDLDSGFQNYAATAATTSFGLRTKTIVAQDELANVVGMVIDNDTEEPVVGATVYIDGNPLVMTDGDGRFQIEDVVQGTYDWSVTSAGYCTAYYLNYDVDAADGATIFTFYISEDFEIEKDREEVQDHNHQQTVPPDIVDMGTYATAASTRAMSTVPNVSDTVSVYYSGRTRSVDRETYIYTVLSSELYGTSYYTDRGLTETETWQLYCAQAIAANTFLEYAMSVYSNHSSYDVCATTCCQVYDPTKVTEAAIEATADIFYTVSGAPATVIVFYEPSSSSYNYIWGAFFSSCGGIGTKTHSTQPALQAVSCSDLATGAGGHRYGLCQMGAAKLAYDGYNAANILLHYYSDCDTEFCMLV